MRETTKVPLADIADSSTTEQLRADIDRGLTGDKVRCADPAAAPLGTDEEAAGTPIDGRTVSAARRLERDPTRRWPPDQGLGAAWILLGFVGVFGAALSAWMLLQ